MSKKFKFRIWDRCNQKHILSDDRDFNKFLIGLDGRIYDNQGKLHEECIIEQYTGICDRNGREIYDGDLINGLHNFGPAGFLERIASIHWHENEGYQWNYWHLPSIEIIGYKNPD